MPFDDTNEDDHGDGGGGYDPHDPEGLHVVARAALAQLSINCDINNLCEFHAGLWMQGMMAQAMVATVQQHEACDESLDMLTEQIAALEGQLETLKEERMKHV